MKVHWLYPFKIENISQLKKVNLASIRLRLGSVLQNIDSSSFEISAGENVANNPDILIIGKLKSTNNESVQFWINKIRLAKQNGTKIVLDYTDNYLDQHNSKFYKPFYDALIGITDRVVTSSNYLKLKMKNYFNGYIEIIEDAIEVPISKPHNSNKGTVNILWFGHASNLKYLVKFIEQSKEFKTLTNIYALTNEEELR